MIDHLMRNTAIVLQQVVVGGAGGKSNLLGHRQNVAQRVVREFMKLCGMVLGDDQAVTRSAGSNVLVSSAHTKESVGLVSLNEFAGRNFPSDNLAEDAVLVSGHLGRLEKEASSRTENDGSVYSKSHCRTTRPEHGPASVQIVPRGSPPVTLAPRSFPRMNPRVYYSPLMRVPAESTAEHQPSGDVISEPLPTPPTVKDVSPSVCLSLMEFKGRSVPDSDLLRQFRSLDDGVTLRMNRSNARSRDTGASAPPSLLQHHNTRFSSASALDLGKSTYGSENGSVCQAFWRELADVWMRREDTIRYCIAINQAAQTSNQPVAHPDDRLDLDRAVPLKPAPAWSRAENQAEFTVRLFG